MRTLTIKEYTILLDNDDYDRVSSLTWTPVQKGNHVYFVNNHTTRKYLHQFILDIRDNFVIDHINQNTFDNQKQNLRHTDKRTNAYNSSKLKAHNTSGFNGVSWDKVKNKWVARMHINGQYTFLGYYTNKIDAVKKIDEEDTKLFGKPRRKRTLAFSDVHGNYQALKQAFTRANVDYEKDKIICLGDVCDGFTQTYEVVEELLKVKNLVLILGNHDAWFISFMKYGSQPNIWIHQGGCNTIWSYNKNVNTFKMESGPVVDDCKFDLSDTIIPVTHQEFFNNAVHYHIEDDMIFVHGGFNPMININKQSQTFLCWDRTIIDTARKKPIYRNDVDIVDKTVLWNKVFIGHTTTQYYGGERYTSPRQFNNLWMLDTGAGFNGKLTIMDVHTEEFWQSDKFEGQR